jgi:hypothetical protein
MSYTELTTTSPHEPDDLTDRQPTPSAPMTYECDRDTANNGHPVAAAPSERGDSIDEPAPRVGTPATAPDYRADSQRVSESALIRRINRKLRPKGESLRKSRRETGYCGRYYVLDVYRNAVIGIHVNLEIYARELGALRDDERLA